MSVGQVNPTMPFTSLMSAQLFERESMVLSELPLQSAVLKKEMLCAEVCNAVKRARKHREERGAKNGRRALSPVEGVPVVGLSRGLSIPPFAHTALQSCGCGVVVVRQGLKRMKLWWHSEVCGHKEWKPHESVG